MSLETSTSMIYAGTFRHGIDQKNRITIPAGWRSDEGTTFYVRVKSEGCIQVLPPEAFRQIKENINKLPSPHERQVLTRQFASESQECKADKQGRMVLPPEFCTRIGFESEIVLVAAYDQFEIWNAAKWETTQAADKSAYPNSASLVGL